MSTLLNEILQEAESSVAGTQECNCHKCTAARNAMLQKETVFSFEIQVPVSELSAEIELESLTDKVRKCLEKFSAFPLSVLPSEKATEIILELEHQVQLNQRSGNIFRTRIGNYLRECLAGTKAKVLIEGERKGKNGKRVSIPEKVRVGGQKRMRFIDVRVVKGKKVIANIEAKKGGSEYKKSQRGGDADLKKRGRGSTFVVRNCPQYSTHPDCVALRNKGSRSREVTLLNEILNEFEIPVRPTLRYGSTGVNVIYLQKRLNYHNASIIPLKEDGIWGPKTNKAVLFFQKMKQIKIDGIVGPITWGKLDELASPPFYYPPIACKLPRPIIAELEAPSKQPSRPPAPQLQRPQIRTCCLLAPPVNVRLLGRTLGTPPFVDVSNLGTHNGFNEVNGLVYTGKAGFIDLGHLRDICDLTKFVYDQMRAGVGNSSANPIQTTQGHAVLHVCPRDELKVAMSIAYHDSLAHEIITYPDKSIPNLGAHNSAFSPEDLCSNNMGTIIAEKAINAVLLSSGATFNGEVTSILSGILATLDAQTPAETQRAFDLIKNRWVDFNIPTSIVAVDYLQRRNFSNIPWKAGHKSDSATPSWLTGDPLLLSRLYSYTNTFRTLIKDSDFPTEINKIRADARSLYGNDFDKP